MKPTRYTRVSARIVAAPSRPLLKTLLAVLLFLVAGLSLSASPDTTLAQLPGNDVVPTMLPTPEMVNPEDDESAALYALARDLEWPTTVWRDYSGRFFIQDSAASNQWMRAMIRPFDFAAGADAAFAAEQEDARIAGYIVTPVEFQSYDAYWASRADDQGQIIERRLHWLAERWIFGVDATGVAYTSAEIEIVGNRHVVISAQHNLPPTGGATPSPPASTPRATNTPIPPPETGTPTPPVETETPQAGTPTPVGCQTFLDVDQGYWAYQYIRDLACQSIVSGYADGTFRPQGQVTRGQLVKMVVLGEQLPTISPVVPSFTDVDRGHVFYRYIETAYSRRIVSGYADRTFRPDDYVTRAQIAKIVVRAKRWALVRPVTGPACDVPRSHWAADYIATAMSQGILSGYADGCFSPDAYATRGQMAKVLSLAIR